MAELFLQPLCICFYAVLCIVCACNVCIVWYACVFYNVGCVCNVCVSYVVSVWCVYVCVGGSLVCIYSCMCGVYAAYMCAFAQGVCAGVCVCVSECVSVLHTHEVTGAHGHVHICRVCSRTMDVILY